MSDIVTCLTPEQADEAVYIGKERQRLAEKWGRKHTNNLRANNQRSERLHIDGVKAEMAAWLYLGTDLTWIRLETGRLSPGMPDIAGFIDVKGVDKKYKRLIVPVTGFNPDFAYLLVCQEDDFNFWVRGWVWGREIDSVQELNPGRPCHIAETANLRHPITLQEEAYARLRVDRQRSTERSLSFGV